MSRNFLLALSVGAAGIILAFCYYFDRKRRCHPQYRKRLHERRQKMVRETRNLNLAASNEPGFHHALPDANDQNMLEHCFYNEIKLGEELITVGKISEGLSHLANAIMMCAQPMPVLNTLKETLPNRLYRPLWNKLQELQNNANHNSSSNKEISSCLDLS